MAKVMPSAKRMHWITRDEIKSTESERRFKKSKTPAIKIEMVLYLAHQKIDCAGWYVTHGKQKKWKIAKHMQIIIIIQN